MEIIDNQNCTLEYMSRILGYNQKLIELRLKTFDIDKKQMLQSYTVQYMGKQQKKPLYDVFRISKRIIAHWRYEKRIQSRFINKKYILKINPAYDIIAVG